MRKGPRTAVTALAASRHPNFGCRLFCGKFTGPFTAFANTGETQSPFGVRPGPCMPWPVAWPVGPCGKKGGSGIIRPVLCACIFAGDGLQKSARRAGKASGIPVMNFCKQEAAAMNIAKRHTGLCICIGAMEKGKRRQPWALRCAHWAAGCA